MHKYEGQANIIPVPCPGLMEFIESGDFDGEEVYIYLHELFEGIKERPLDGNCSRMHSLSIRTGYDLGDGWRTCGSV